MKKYLVLVFVFVVALVFYGASPTINAIHNYALGNSSVISLDSDDTTPPPAPAPGNNNTAGPFDNFPIRNEDSGAE